MDVYMMFNEEEYYMSRALIGGGVDFPEPQVIVGSFEYKTACSNLEV